MAITDWSMNQPPVAAIVPISATEVTYTYPPDRYFVRTPIIMCTIDGAATHVSYRYGVTHDPAAGAEIHTFVTITFQPSAVGSKAHLWIMGT